MWVAAAAAVSILLSRPLVSRCCSRACFCWGPLVIYFCSHTRPVMSAHLFFLPLLNSVFIPPPSNSSVCVCWQHVRHKGVSRHLCFVCSMCADGRPITTLKSAETPAASCLYRCWSWHCLKACRQVISAACAVECCLRVCTASGYQFMHRHLLFTCPCIP